jgi:hypothetical protein
MKEKLPSPAFVLSAAAADCCTPALLHLRCRNLSESFEAACHFAFVPLYQVSILKFAFFSTRKSTRKGLSLIITSGSFTFI